MPVWKSVAGGEETEYWKRSNPRVVKAIDSAEHSEDRLDVYAIEFPPAEFACMRIVQLVENERLAHTKKT